MFGAIPLPEAGTGAMYPLVVSTFTIYIIESTKNMQPGFLKPAVKQMVGSTATGDYPCRSKISDLISVLSFRRKRGLLAKRRQDSKGNGVQR